MLFFRRSCRGKTLYIPLVMAFLCLFQLAFAGNSPSAVLLDKIVASVNDEVITWSELMNVIIIEGRQFLGQAKGEERARKIKSVERPILNNLIDMKLQLQVAHDMGLEVGIREIEGAIEDIKRKYGLTEDALMASLEAEGLTADDYRSRMEDQILLQKVINVAVRNNIVVTDEDIKKYYEENRARFDVEEKFRISQIFFSLPEDINNKDAVEAMAQDLYGRVNQGEDFAQLAREHSEDPSSQYGGDLGYLSRGSVLKEIEDTAGLLAIGEVSSPFWSAAGLHIIKLEDKVGGGGLDKVRDQVKEILLQSRFEKNYRDWLAGLKENAFIEIKL